MANYKEEQLNGAKWQRCNAVHITNSYGVTPHIIFGEEQIVLVEGSPPIRININSQCVAAFNAQSVINIINPLTGEMTGAQYTHQQLYEILYSLYVDTALKRDIEAAENAAANAAYISSGGQVQQ